MRRRSFPARPSLWRHRFVQIARGFDVPQAAAPVSGFGLRARPAPGAVRGGRRTAGLFAA